MNKKNILFLILITLMIIGQTTISYACVGARPLGMGGAFISIADDVNAIYWNPAGLVQLKQQEITYTRTMNNRDTYNYDNFLGIANYNQNSGVAYALGYIKVDDYYPIGISGKNTLIYQDKTDSWYIFSLSKKISDKLSIGGNIRYMSNEMTYESNGYLPASDSDSHVGIDLSALYHVNKQLSLGVLIQDANQPEIKFPYLYRKYKMIRNIRPSIAYKIDDSLNIAASIYDATNESDIDMSNRLRLGFEKKLNDTFTVRAGRYGENMTIGAGYKSGNYHIDYAFLGDNLGDTHQLGITYKY